MLKEIQDFKKQQKVGAVGQKIITAIGVVGFVAAAVMAPNVLKLFDDQARHRKWYIWKVLKDLEDKRLIARIAQNGRKGYVLTKKGEKLAEGYELRTLSIKKPCYWDGKWRIVMFDIKEFRRGARDELRSVLVGLGFEKLQRSAWVYPYPCADVIAIIKHKYELGKEVLYLEVDILENDHWLRKQFSLE